MKTDPTHKPNRILLSIVCLLGLAATSSVSLGFPIGRATELALARFGDLIATTRGDAASDSRLARGPQTIHGLDPRSYVRNLPFGPEIERTARRHRLDALLLASVVEVESSFQPDAVSPKGAVGLMQLMPFHLADGVVPVDPRRNLELGATYLATLKQRYGGNLALTLAAYHAGPGAVDRFGGVPPYASTQQYVRRVLSLYGEHLEQLVDGNRSLATRLGGASDAGAASGRAG